MWFLEKVDLISGSPRDPPGPVAGAGASQGAPPQALVALRPTAHVTRPTVPPVRSPHPHRRHRAVCVVFEGAVPLTVVQL